jgi:hypothetical protein
MRMKMVLNFTIIIIVGLVEIGVRGRREGTILQYYRIIVVFFLLLRGILTKISRQQVLNTTKTIKL